MSTQSPSTSIRILHGKNMLNMGCGSEIITHVRKSGADKEITSVRNTTVTVLIEPYHKQTSI